MSSAVNKTTLLECIVEDDDAGKPHGYTFNWTRNNDSGFRAQNNGIFVFVPSSVAYQDVYSCVPGNTAGVGRPGEIELTIKGRPFSYEAHFMFFISNTCTLTHPYNHKMK